MSASLFGERFIGRREPAWHRLGEVFPQDLQLTATEAMEKADIMFRVDKYPLVAQMPDGTSIETNTFGVVREPTNCLVQLVRNGLLSRLMNWDVSLTQLANSIPLKRLVQLVRVKKSSLLWMQENLR